MEISWELNLMQGIRLLFCARSLWQIKTKTKLEIGLQVHREAFSVTHSSQQTLGLLDGAITAEEADHHHHGAHGDQNVDT